MDYDMSREHWKTDPKCSISQGQHPAVEEGEEDSCLKSNPIKKRKKPVKMKDEDG
jgi:hypothetical protein